jgi:alkylhydroperoxidase family enzyme
MNSALSRADGITDPELAALTETAASGLFTERERAALAYAAAITSDNTVVKDVFTEVQRHFNADEIVELTATITWEICAAKFNRALQIEGQGISAVCRLPGR